jgi:hypothetical protein
VAGHCDRNLTKTSSWHDKIIVKGEIIQN